MRRLLLIVPATLVLTHCREEPSSVTDASSPSAISSGSGETQEIINVSAYDPKERHRSGQGYSQHDVSALARNGAKGLIARAGKGGNLDTKCPDFITSADRAGLLPGLYYRVQKHVSPGQQAEQFVERAQALARSRGWSAPALLLCGDYDGDLSAAAILSFMNRVEAKTGVIPISYLENSQELKRELSTADPKTKAHLLRAPYWLALYSHETGAETPMHLVKQYNVWPDWTMWQYGGVEWKNSRSNPRVYSHGRYRNSLYFGNLDRPAERNVFRGSEEMLDAFWQRHGIALQ